jgi:galactokinase
VRIVSPGRVNLIGDHVDYVGGLVLPMAIDLGTVITVDDADHGGNTFELRSADEDDPVTIRLPIDPGAPLPDGWGAMVAATLREVAATGVDVEAGVGVVRSTLPIGAGLSSSSSFTIAVALAAGFRGPAVELARLALRAEVAATGVPGGLMDQLTITHGVDGHALLIDCADDTVEPVRLPAGTAVHAVHCGVGRRLAGSPYAERRASCEAAEAVIGPLRSASLAAVDRLDDPTVRARARHVVSEIERVRIATAAARAGDPERFGAAMVDSHASLRDDFEVSIPELDRLVDRLCATPGVYGARLTGAGFGGCVVTLVDERVDPATIGGWRVRPVGGAKVVDT